MFISQHSLKLRDLLCIMGLCNLVTQSLLTSLLRMLDENEGLWKEPILSPQIADFRLTAHDRRQNGGRSAKPLNTV